MKYSSHNEYINKEGEEVPSVTTILKILNKPSLVKWANYLGFKRQKVEDILEQTSTIGTAVHDMLESYIMKKPFRYVENKFYTRSLLGQFLDKFMTWESENELDVEFMEKKFISDKFGGTIDLYGTLNGKKTIIDFKTSKKVHGAMFLQLGAYCYMLEENGYDVEQVGIMIVNADKVELKYFTREHIQSYIDVILTMTELFHQWYTLTEIDKWDKPIDKPKKRPKKIIVAGEREFCDYELLEKTLKDMTSPNDIIISGGAKGADMLGEQFADEYNMCKEVYKPEYDRYPGKSAPMRRNEYMGDISDELIAFWDGESRGTRHMIKYMESKGKKVTIINY